MKKFSIQDARTIINEICDAAEAGDYEVEEFIPKEEKVVLN